MLGTVAEKPENLREQANRCRWLADRIIDRDVIDQLLELALELEKRAAKPCA